MIPSFRPSVYVKPTTINKASAESTKNETIQNQPNNSKINGGYNGLKDRMAKYQK